MVTARFDCLYPQIFNWNQNPDLARVHQAELRPVILHCVLLQCELISLHIYRNIVQKWDVTSEYSQTILQIYLDYSYVSYGLGFTKEKLYPQDASLSKFFFCGEDKKLSMVCSSLCFTSLMLSKKNRWSAQNRMGAEVWVVIKTQRRCKINNKRHLVKCFKTFTYAFHKYTISQL